ncbi:MAG: undecaprenyldiphospho-muramoylpentapeptide beta-N-acetylglucosaminyltransferase [Caulobacterales bacterium]|nr:undecaprenyldiphospho-muramoylpentapeptide beta-N-acetylglucosaminyltransferase [Caulobacterales bacterium]
MSKVAVLAAGGTGGHLFPAQALAEALIARGWRVVLATDKRGAQYAHDFPAEERLALDAATASNPIAMVGAIFQILAGVAQARSAFSRLKPSVVVGFGGYPSVPALLAAATTGRPIIIHEQNAVLGRSNRALARFARKIAAAFPTLERVPPSLGDRVEIVGNPVRADIRDLHGRAFKAKAERLHVLITGGSQGARILSETAPRALAQIAERLRDRLHVHQQTRSELLDSAREIYADASIQAEVAPFFRDMALRLGQAHLVIGRAGASTCSELAVAGVPSILVPLKIATDDHQRLNACSLADAGAAMVILEDDLTVDRLAEAVQAMLDDPATLERRAAAAHTVGIPDAAERLADLVELQAGQG